MNIVYSENISMFTFLQSYNEGGNEVYVSVYMYMYLVDMIMN